MKLAKVGVPLFLAVVATPALSASGDDGIALQLSKGPSAGNVSLQWTNGQAPFSIFRATSPVDVTTPGSFQTTTAGAAWVDTPPVGGIHFYYVQGSCTYAPPEICDGLDNDCDPATPDGAQEPLIGTACDGADGDLCSEGVRVCSAGALGCTDTTVTSFETCSGDKGDEDCDGLVDEGFVVNSNPACTSYAYLGAISGDTGAGGMAADGYSEKWFRVNLNESSSGTSNLTAIVSLYSPPGSDFDLYLRCLGCSGNTGGWSLERGLDGHIDVAFIRKNDDPQRVDSFPLLIEVRLYESHACGEWFLQVQGNTGAPYATCYESPF